MRVPGVLLLTLIGMTGLMSTGVGAQSAQRGEADPSPQIMSSPTQGMTTLPVAIGGATVLNRVVTLHIEDADIAEVLRVLEGQTGIRLAFSRDLIPLDRRVSVAVENGTVRQVLDQVLVGASVDVVISGSHAVLVPRPVPPPPPPSPVSQQATGILTGRVVSAENGGGLSSAHVVVDGTRYRALTNQTGHFRIVGVPVGEYTLTVERIGYAEVRQGVMIRQDQTTVVNLAMDISVIPLDEVIVTGTGAETMRRAIPNPITVIGVPEIERKQPQTVLDLLRGEVPSLLPLSQGKNDRTGEIFMRGNAGWSAEDYVKVYVDGIQVASRTALATLDPRNIERVEVVRGPQASVIYGSEAASGVIQIWTKKGHGVGQARPQIEVQASMGLIESDWKPEHVGVPLQYDLSVGLSGGGDNYSYRAGVVQSKVGEWVLGYSNESTGYSAAARASQGPVSVEFTAMLSDRRPQGGADPIWMRYDQTEWCPQCGNEEYYPNTVYVQGQSTVGVSFKYQATDRWDHNLTVGSDMNRTASWKPEPTRLFPSDTLVDLFQSEVQRRTFRYNTTYNTEFGTGITSRFILGFDHWHYDAMGHNTYNLLQARPTVRTSGSTYSNFTNNSWWNAGYFGMAELGFWERVYITMAARIEEMQNLGDDYGRPLQPRVGAAYVHPLGPVEAKVRAQWGKGIRLPPAHARVGSESAWSIVLPNPDMGPEEKVGWDAGLELYFGTTASLEITRYDEAGIGLIQQVDIDRASTPPVYQYQNIGRVGSKGWEVEGTMHVRRMSLRANYAYNDNRIEQLSNQYLDSPFAGWEIGDRRTYIPRHSGGATATLRFLRGSATVNTSWMNNWRALDALLMHDVSYGGVPGPPSFRDYYIDYGSMWRWHFRSEQTLSDRTSVFFRVDNLLNETGTDYENYSVSQGRTTHFGVRMTL